MPFVTDGHCLEMSAHIRRSICAFLYIEVIQADLGFNCAIGLNAVLKRKPQLAIAKVLDVNLVLDRSESCSRFPLPGQPEMRRFTFIPEHDSVGFDANGASIEFPMLRKALPQISYYAHTGNLGVFTSRLPGQRFSETKDVNGFKVTVSGEHNGEAIVIHPSGHEFLMAGFRSSVSMNDPTFQWSMMKSIRVRRVR
jgi:hypothetical protein